MCDKWEQDAKPGRSHFTSYQGFASFLCCILLNVLQLSDYNIEQKNYLSLSRELFDSAGQMLSPLNYCKKKQ